MILENYVDGEGTHLSLRYYSDTNGVHFLWVGDRCMLDNGMYPDRAIDECHTVIDIMIDKLVEARRCLETLGQIT